MDGSNTIRIHTKEDLAEVQSELRKQRKSIFWCDGLEILEKRTSSSQTRATDGDADEGK